MSPETQAQIGEVWASIRASKERTEEFERSTSEAHRKALERMDRMEAKWERKQAEADARWDRKLAESEARWERKMDAIRKLVLTGMKMMVELQRADKELKAEMKALAASQKAYFDSLRDGKNGNGRKR